MAGLYVPDEGDVIWIDFTPQSGHEQAGRRPAVVLSPRAYNGRAGLLVCVPVTNQSKGYPFEVALGGDGTTGVALADQVRSLDWRARRAERKDRVSGTVVADVKAKIKALLRIT